MRAFLRTALLVLLLLPSTASAQGYRAGDVGLGVSLGSPTGIDAKFGLGGKSSIDAWFGLHFLLHDALGIGVEYNADIYSFRVGNTHDALYVGGGGMFMFLDHGVFRDHHDHVDVGAGVRVPFGVDFIFTGPPINLFAELAPGFSVVSDHGFDLVLDIAVGIRFML